MGSSGLDPVFLGLPHDGLLWRPTGHDQILCKSVCFVGRFYACCRGMLDACLTPHATHANRLTLCIQWDTKSQTVREHRRPYGRFR